MNEKSLITAAKILSTLFRPFYMPFIGMLLLFVFSYLSFLPFWTKMKILLIVYFLSILLPTLLINFYRNYQGWSPIELGAKERRLVPYLICFVCYFVCYYVVNLFHIPHSVGSVLVAAMVIEVLCTVINLKWKISSHMAAIGGLAGALVAFAQIFSFNPVWWLCLVILIAGFIGTSRMILRQHTLAQVLAGFFLGIVCAFWAVILN